MNSSIPGTGNDYNQDKDKHEARQHQHTHHSPLSHHPEIINLPRQEAAARIINEITEDIAPHINTLKQYPPPR